MTILPAARALSCALFSFASGTLALAAYQTPCPGAVVEPVGLPLRATGNTMGVNGDLIAVPLSGQWSAGGPGADGGAAIYRVAPGASDVVLEDVLVIPELGAGFAARNLGCAIADSGAVLIARKTPANQLSEVVQLRRPAGGGPVSVNRMTTTQPIPSTEFNRRIDSDGNRAVVMSHSAGAFIVLDFFAVDAAGNWFREDTVRGGTVPGNFGFALFDVRLKGDRCIVSKSSSVRPLEAFERTSQGRWTALSLDPAVLDSLPGEGYFASNTIYNRVGIPDGEQARVFDRLPSGAWSLAATIDVTDPASPQVRISGFRSSGSLFSFNVQNFNGAELGARLYRRTASGAVQVEAFLDAPIQALTDRFAVVGAGFSKLKVIDIADLVGDVHVCTDRGFTTCAGQRAGDLNFRERFVAFAAEDGDLFLSSAPAGQFAFVVGSDTRQPSAGMLSSLCVAPGLFDLRFPTVATIAADGTASWSVLASALPLSSGGVLAGSGTQFTFQAVVRTIAGTATSRAVTVTL